MRLLQRLGTHHQIVDLIVLAFERHAFLGPALAHEIDRLIEYGARLALFIRETEPRVLARLIPAPDTQIDPPVGHQVEEREILSHPHRIMERQHHDAGTRPNALCPRRDGGQRDPRRCAVAIFREVVLGGPD